MWFGLSGDHARNFLIGIIFLFLFLFICGKIEENYKKYQNNSTKIYALSSAIVMTIYDILPIIVIIFVFGIWYII